MTQKIDLIAQNTAIVVTKTILEKLGPNLSQINPISAISTSITQGDQVKIRGRSSSVKRDRQSNKEGEKVSDEKCQTPPTKKIATQNAVLGQKAESQKIQKENQVTVANLLEINGRGTPV